MREFTDEELRQAYETIREWGINEGGFVGANFRQFMSGGQPSDNSIQLTDFFREQLQIIVDLGLVEARTLLNTRQAAEPKEGK